MTGAIKYIIQTPEDIFGCLLGCPAGSDRNDRDRKLVDFTYLRDVSNLLFQGVNQSIDPKYQEDIPVGNDLTTKYWPSPLCTLNPKFATFDIVRRCDSPDVRRNFNSFNFHPASLNNTRGSGGFESQHHLEKIRFQLQTVV